MKNILLSLLLLASTSTVFAAEKEKKYDSYPSGNFDT